MNSEEIAQAAADLATVEQLHARILEWEDCYDRLAGAFDLHMAIGACQEALSDYAGRYYDVVLGEMAERAERAEADARALNDSCQAWIEGEARWRVRAEQAEALALTLQSQRDQAEAEGAALRRVLTVLSHVGDVESARNVAQAMLRRVGVGTSLLAELETARAIVAALRLHRDAGGEVWHSIDADLAAYDAAARGRAG